MDEARDLTPQTLQTPKHYWAVVGLVVASLVLIGIWQGTVLPPEPEQASQTGR